MGTTIAKDEKAELVENKFTIQLERIGRKCIELNHRLRFVLSDAHKELDGRTGTSMLESMLFNIEDALCNIDDRLSDGLLQTKYDDGKSIATNDNVYLIQLERILCLIESLQKRLVFILMPASINKAEVSSNNDSTLTGKLILVEDGIDDILARLDDQMSPERV